VRFSDEELKHQALFRASTQMVAETLPDGYVSTSTPTRRRSRARQEHLGGAWH
jgi:hypothetical protein